jgi:hypothetical protein
VIFIKTRKTISAIKNEILKSQYRFPDQSLKWVLMIYFLYPERFPFFDFQVEIKKLGLN